MQSDQKQLTPLQQEVQVCRDILSGANLVDPRSTVYSRAFLTLHDATWLVAFDVERINASASVKAA